ncbi:hypothetical protein SBRCBS47491_000478 [Sporothrix bragantina]|uniref:Uncharacterized protein n=1 Tax=Sporothrix bragantina TaxID=671064 RepID=A0ABP0AQM2_9PEZI
METAVASIITVLGIITLIALIVLCHRLALRHAAKKAALEDPACNPNVYVEQFSTVPVYRPDGLVLHNLQSRQSPSMRQNNYKTPATGQQSVQMYRCPALAPEYETFQSRYCSRVYEAANISRTSRHGHSSRNNVAPARGAPPPYTLCDDDDCKITIQPPVYTSATTTTPRVSNYCALQELPPPPSTYPGHLENRVYEQPYC